MDPHKKQSPWSFVVLGAGGLLIGLMALYGAALCTFRPAHPACRSSPDEPRRLGKIGAAGTGVGAVLLIIGLYEVRRRPRG